VDWTDNGIVLAVRRHGESAVILSLLTAEHGRHMGLVRGGAGTRARGLYQIGNIVSAEWRARLEAHLGSYTCELISAPTALYLDDPKRLAGLTSACAVADMALPEREPHGRIYQGLTDLLAVMGHELWPVAYIRWELALLTELGFGLDLGTCAATGANDHLAYVSPRSGRAVSLAAGEAYRDKLLILPGFLTDERADQPIEDADIAAGLTLTGFFLERHLFAASHSGMPAARHRMLDRLVGPATISGRETET
jgi:DNA repair protein RecO (recombination protein O)